MLLAHDTETTGLPLFDKPSEHPDQPHIVQLAAILRHPNRAVEPQKIINYIVKPNGWIISPELTAIHGISQEQALDVGVPLNDVLDDMLSMVNKSTVIIGHNLKFDIRMLRIQEKRRYGGAAPDDALLIGAAIGTRNMFCTQQNMTKIMNLPPTEKMLAAGRKTPKSPKLTEAFSFCYPGAAFPGKAHSALSDAKASLGVYFWLQDQKANEAA